MKTLETERLILKPTHSDLLEGVLRAVEVSLDELRVWMPWAVEPDRDQTLDFLRRAAGEWDGGLERHFTLLHEGEVCGQCSLDRPDPAHSTYEMGYWMRSDLCGLGLMTEGARAVVEFGFDESAAHRLELHAGVGNQGSIRVAEKLGFQREGMRRGAGRGTNGWYDTYAYGLLADDARP